MISFSFLLGKDDKKGCGDDDGDDDGGDDDDGDDDGGEGHDPKYGGKLNGQARLYVFFVNHGNL